LHDCVLSNQQQQNTVPTQAQIVSAPAASISPRQGVHSRPEGGSQQQSSSNNQTSSTTAPRRRRGCFICDDFGHIARSCPLNNANNQPFRYGNSPCGVTGASGPAGQNSAQPADTFVTRGAGSKVNDEYVCIDIVIDGKSHLALIDTGYQLSLVPPSFIGDRPVQPSSEKLYAANGSLIHGHGTVELPVTIGGHHSVVKILVTQISGNQCSLLLGCQKTMSVRILPAMHCSCMSP